MTRRHLGNHGWRHHRSQAGFTLVELMAIVVIVGVLALIAGYNVRKYITSSKTTEATYMIGTIKTAEEAYKDETFTYLNATGNITTFYPANATPGRAKVQWGGGDATIAGQWQILGVNPPNPVLFVYSCVAGAAGTTPPAPGFTVGNWPAAASTVPWYVVEASADFDGDGRTTIFAGASFAGEIYSNGYNL